MIQHRPMVHISRPSDSGSEGAKDTEFIRCIDVWEPQIHNLWCLRLGNITRKVHPTARVEVGAGTVGEFTTNYLSENGRRILIIRQTSINRSVQLLGIPEFSGEVDFSLFKTCKLLLILKAGDTVKTSSRTGELSRGDLTEMFQSPGVLLFLPVRLTCLGVWLTCTLLRAAGVINSFVAGVASV